MVEFFGVLPKMSKYGRQYKPPLEYTGCQLSMIWWFCIWDQFLKLGKVSDPMCRDSEEREGAERDTTVRRL